MIMTPKEAKTKICPVMGYRWKKDLNCYADACAIWTWDGSFSYGYCGLAHKEREVLG